MDAPDLLSEDIEHARGLLESAEQRHGYPKQYADLLHNGLQLLNSVLEDHPDTEHRCSIERLKKTHIGRFLSLLPFLEIKDAFECFDFLGVFHQAKEEIDMLCAMNPELNENYLRFTGRWKESWQVIVDNMK